MPEKIKTFFLILGTGIAVGICYGLALALTLLFARHCPLWALFLTTIVSFGLAGRLKRHWQQKNWLAFFITFPLAFFCVGLPASMIWIAIIQTYYESPFDWIDALIIVSSIFSGIFISAYYWLVKEFWNESNPARSLRQIIKGSRIITNLNED